MTMVTLALILYVVYLALCPPLTGPADRRPSAASRMSIEQSPAELDFTKTAWSLIVPAGRRVTGWDSLPDRGTRG